MRGRDRVPGAGPVDEPAVLTQPVPGPAVETLHGEDRACPSPFGGVVEDHVEDDLEPGGVELVDHGGELGDLTTVVAGGIAAMGGEPGQRRVTPVVRQPLALEERLRDVVSDRHELDRGDTEFPEMVDDAWGTGA
jgi:hypothetical protein